MKSKRLLLTLLMAFLVPWAAMAQETLTVYDGTANNSYVPFNGLYADTQGAASECVIPSDELDAMTGGQITAMKFYITSTASAAWTGTHQVYIGEVDATTLTGITGPSAFTVVKTASFDATGTELTVEFDEPYTYEGGNLLIGTYVSVAGNYKSAVFAGETQTENTGWYRNGASAAGSAVKFLPKTTFTYESGSGVACAKPETLVADNVTSNSASVSWTGGSGVYNIELNGNIIEENYEETSYDLTGLTPATAYTVRVQSVCEGETNPETGDPELVFSGWKTVSFNTECGAITTFPWSEDFESYATGTFNALCWVNEHISGSGTNLFSVSTTNSHGTSTKQLYLPDMSSGTMTKLMLPEMTLPENYQFCIDVYRNTTSYAEEGIRVFASTNGEIDGATELAFISRNYTFANDVIPAETASGWYTYELPIGISGTCYIILRGESRYGSATYMDNFVVKQMPTCLKPTDLAANASTNSAELSWTANSGETVWTVYYKKTTDEEYNEVGTASNTHTLEGLVAATNYQYYVVANCSADDASEASDVFTFTTECDVIDALGYSENFDSYTVASAYTPSARVLPICWNAINTTTSSSYAVYPSIYYYSSTNYANSTPNSLRLYSYYSSYYSDYDPQPQYAILPEMSGLAGMQVNLWARGYNTSSTFKIGTMSDPTDASTFEAITEQSLTTSYQEFEYVVPATCTNGYLAIMIDAASSSRTTNSVYIDDITIAEAPTCIKPTGLEATADALTATVTWVSEVGAYEVAHATAATANPDENIAGTATEETYTMNDLALGDHYFWVRANCGSDGYSEWVGPANVHIGYCVPTPSNVDGNGISNVTFGMGENVVNNDTPKATYADYHTMIGAVQASVESTIAITYATGYTYGTIIWVDLDNSLSFEDSEIVYTGISASTNPTTLNAAITIPATVTPGDYIMRIGGADSGFDSYISDPSTTAPSACYTGNWACFQDYTLRVLEAPDCMAATNVTVDNITTNSAVISWTNNNGEEATYTVMQGDEVLTTTAVDSYTLNGLTASTNYPAGTFTIVSNCDETAVANVPEFATECEVIVVDAANPFTEDFEGDWTPLCWESIASGIYNWSKSTTNHTENGSGCAYSGYYGDIYLVMPDIQISSEADGAQLSFWSYNNYTTDYDKNSVVLLNGENETELWSPESVSQSWVETTIDLSAYVGQTISLAFKYEGNNAHGWYVDDVQVVALKNFTKEIAGYGQSSGGYYLIASPVSNAVTPTTANGFITNAYDLYYFDQAVADSLEWINFKDGTDGGYNIVNGTGYLYASADDTELIFAGTPYEGNGVVALAYSEGAHFPGWNLVGNPFNVTAYPGRPFYVMNPDGRADIIAATGNSVEPMEGIFVVAESANDQSMTFSTTAPDSEASSLALNVIRNRGEVIDRAIISFGADKTLPKLQLNPNHTKVYIPQEGKDFAVANAKNDMGEMPVSFKAESNGTYTLSFSNSNVEFGYLHLIDNLTGADIDLLETPAYSFEAKTTDYANRFRLVFATSSSNDDSFAYFNNGNLIVNNEGNATLQVVDVMGRILSSETISGNCSKHINAAPGVYMLRLVNGNDVKVQKMVVR